MQKQIESQQILRFATAGSVDDGKSTLIGRLLFDSKSLFDDQLESIEVASKRKGLNAIDLAMFTDGLREEREQAITIDVAYRYFTTPRRKFILADTPGHIEYTRNMITGASTAHAILILIDARNGIIEQTRRHTFIADLLGVEYLIVCINKMDLVDYSLSVFSKIETEFKEMMEGLSIQKVLFIPMNALEGDNVVEHSKRMPWYEGLPLLEILEGLEVDHAQNAKGARFPIQTVIRPQGEEFRDYRGYAGKIVSGEFKKGEEIILWPSGIRSAIKSIHFYNTAIEKAHSPMSVTIQLEDALDAGRGSMMTSVDHPPSLLNEFEMMVCWLVDSPAVINKKYSLQQTTSLQQAIIVEIISFIDIETLSIKKDGKELKKNDIARISIKVGKPIIADAYQVNKNTGSVILIDNDTNETVAAGMIMIP